jgi:hypothetical protein
MVRTLVVLLIAGLLSSCQFDSSGLASRDTRPGREAPSPDGPRDVSVHSDRRVDMLVDAPPVVDTLGVDGQPPDLAPLDKTLVDKPKPDLSPCVACGGGTPICCDKGQGLKCYGDALGCACTTATKAPCTGPYAVCCDSGAGPAKCTATAYNCRCDVSRPCSGSYPICCDPGTGVAVCGSSSGGCVCDPSNGQPCGGSYPVCCNKGSGSRCSATAFDCACSGASATAAPCQGSYSYCCKVGGSAKCASSMHACECDPAQPSCGDCHSCQNENGWTCHSCY